MNKERVETQVVETIQKILDRNWMEKREEIENFHTEWKMF